MGKKMRLEFNIERKEKEFIVGILRSSYLYGNQALPNPTTRYSKCLWFIELLRFEILQQTNYKTNTKSDHHKQIKTKVSENTIFWISFHASCILVIKVLFFS